MAMNGTNVDLSPNAKKAKMSTIKGQRTRHVVTLNPNKANPTETLYIDIPKLKLDSCLVPGSLHLLFDFKNANAKSWYLNNLSKLLQSQLTIKMAGEVAYDNVGESTIGVYRDLWKSVSERNDMVEYGVAGENLRKLIAKDDTGASTRCRKKDSKHSEGHPARDHEESDYRGRCVSDFRLVRCITKYRVWESSICAVLKIKLNSYKTNEAAYVGMEHSKRLEERWYEIYRIFNAFDNDSYIGWTSNTITQRLNEHVHDSRRNDNKLARKIRDVGRENLTIVALVSRRMTQIEAQRIEGDIIDLLQPTLNSQSSGRYYDDDGNYDVTSNRADCSREYYVKNKERIKDYMRDYRKKYHAKNKDKFLEKTMCECGGSFTYSNKAQHERTQRHLNSVSVFSSPPHSN